MSHVTLKAMRLFFALLAVVLLVYAQERRAPGFALMDQNGKWQDLQDYRGKVVLIDIMQTTCPHCQTLTGVLEKIKPRYGSRMQVLTVVVANGESPQTVGNYIKNYKVTNPVLIDCGQMTASYVMATPAKPTVHFPHLAIVDGNGRIKHDLAYESGSDAKFSEAGLTVLLDAMVKPAAATPPAGKKK